MRQSAAGGRGRVMNGALERLAGLAARRWWVFIVSWVIILGGLLAAKNAFGGEYVNNYTVSGSDSAAGLNVLNSTFPQQGGYGGQIVFHATKGTVADQQSAVNQSVSNVSKLPDVIKAVSPFASSNTGAVSKDGTIAYASVGWNVNPDSLDSSYLDKLNNAVAPATKAGLQVEYGAGAGEIGQKTSDIKSEVIGLACALVLLLAMFGSLVAAAIPLVSAIFSVLVRARAARAARTADHVPDHRADHRHPARARRRRRLRAVPSGQVPGAAGCRDGRRGLGPAGCGHLRDRDRGRGHHCLRLRPGPVHLRRRLRRRRSAWPRRSSWWSR